jgi:glyoxalase superfamily protein
VLLNHDPVTFSVHSITIDCTDWARLVEFWAAASDFEEDPTNPNAPGDPVGMLISPDRRLQLLFIPVPEPRTTKNRIHLDVLPTDGTRDEEVERLLTLGAALVDDRRNDDGTGWVVLADPEGNEFCVERSAAERSSDALHA